MKVQRKINLLPIEYRSREANQKANIAYVIALVIGLAVAGAGWVSMGEMSKGKQDELSRLQAAQPTATPQPQVNKALADVTQRITALNGLAAAEVNWSSVFTALTAATAQNVILSNSTVSTTANGVMWKATGTAPSAMAFAGYAEALKNSKVLTSFKVEAFAYAITTGKVDFTISGVVPSSSVLYQPASTPKP